MHQGWVTGSISGTVTGRLGSNARLADGNAVAIDDEFGNGQTGNT